MKLSMRYIPVVMLIAFAAVNADIFNANLTASEPMFSYTFTIVGHYPFFCIPHYGLDMFGNIHVETGAANDASTWSAVKRLYA
ncbi:hypothetical protein KKA85_00480 [bacterium]|nr:hypothetical protein [bacterium]MBU1674238.1 hypothetical protein [bacterium]